MGGANAHSPEVTTCSASPHGSGARRPNRSESGPITSCPTPPPSSMAETESWAKAAVEPSSRATSGSDGRYMSTVNAGSAASAPSMSTQRYVERARIRVPKVEGGMDRSYRNDTTRFHGPAGDPSHAAHGPCDIARARVGGVRDHESMCGRYASFRDAQ